MNPPRRSAGASAGTTPQRWQAPHRIEFEVARRTLRAGTLFSAAAAALFALLYLWAGPTEFVLPNAVAALCLAAIGQVRSRNVVPLIYAAVSVGMLLFGWQLLLLGRVDNGITVWFLVPCMAAMILGVRPLALYCFGASVAEVVGVVIAARAGWLRGRVELAAGDIVMAASIVAVLSLCSVFAVVAFRARQRLLREVELRNAELAAALEDARLARQVAEDAAQAKERFLANVTHEIRTPLNGIVGSAEMLQRTALSPEQAPLADALGTSTRNLLELVNAMLDHAKLVAGRVLVERSAVSLHRLARDLSDLYGPRAAQKGLVLELRVSPRAPPWVSTDGLKLAQIVGNLLANAIKFTAQGSVTVTLDCHERGPAAPGPLLRVAVADTGIGIPAPQLSAIFLPFVQGDASIARTYGGTGLGLAIARQLTELLNGTLTVESRPGAGSCFRLELPVHHADAPPSAPVADDAALPRGLRVLLVEDNAINRLIAIAMLRALEAEVAVAHDGLAAVELALAGRFDVVLMDLQMPGLDGIEATREIRRRESQDGRATVPVVALTGNSPDDYGAACAAAGMTGYLMKPVRLDALRGLLAALPDRG